jgi:DNA replication and repair protein RecF
VAALNRLVRAVHSELTDGAERLRLRYAPSLEIEARETVATIQTAFAEQVKALRPRELAAGLTLVGPHRDEMRFLINETDAGIYGSRGQQRTATLALKLAEVDLMRQQTGEDPVLLLDDVLSELDAHRRRFVLHFLENGPQQAVLTATDLHILPETFVRNCRLWRVQMGQLSLFAGD